LILQFAGNFPLRRHKRDGCAPFAVAGAAADGARADIVSRARCKAAQHDAPGLRVRLKAEFWSSGLKTTEASSAFVDAPIRWTVLRCIFEQSHTGAGNVTVTFQNNHKQRRKFIDSTAANTVVSATLFKILTDNEKRLINHVVEYKTIKVAQAAKLLNKDCGMGNPQITPIAQISFSSSASSAKSADKTSRPPASAFM
jgi:hypothetical protein